MELSFKVIKFNIYIYIQIIEVGIGINNLLKFINFFNIIILYILKYL